MQHRTWYHNSVCSTAVPGSECSAACVLCIYESTATRKLQSLGINVHLCCMGACEYQWQIVGERSRALHYIETSPAAYTAFPYGSAASLRRHISTGPASRLVK